MFLLHCAPLRLRHTEYAYYFHWPIELVTICLNRGLTRINGLRGLGNRDCYALPSDSVAPYTLRSFGAKAGQGNLAPTKRGLCEWAKFSVYSTVPSIMDTICKDFGSS